MPHRDPVTPGNHHPFGGDTPVLAGISLGGALVAGVVFGLLSLIRLFPYPYGGGFIPLGAVLVGPLAGLFLGPWLGALAGLLGGIFGLWLAPHGYPLNVIDILRTGVLPPLFWGLAHPLYRRVYRSLGIVLLALCAIWPYYVPGATSGYNPAGLAYWLSLAWAPASLLVYHFFQERLLNGLHQGSFARRWVCSILYNLSPAACWLLIWLVIYFARLNYPSGLAQLFNLTAGGLYLPTVALLAGSATLLVKLSAQYLKLPAVPGTLFD